MKMKTQKPLVFLKVTYEVDPKIPQLFFLFTFHEFQYLIHKNLSDMTMGQSITFPNPAATPAPSNQNQTASPNEVLDVLIDIPF